MMKRRKNNYFKNKSISNQYENNWLMFFKEHKRRKQKNKIQIHLLMKIVLLNNKFKAKTLKKIKKMNKIKTLKTRKFSLNHHLKIFMRKLSNKDNKNYNEKNK